MGSELKKKMLAAVASSQLLRIAAVLPDVAVCTLSRILADPSQRLTYQEAPMVIAHQAHLRVFVLVSSPASQRQVHTRSHNQRTSEEVIHGNLSKSTLLEPDSLTQPSLDIFSTEMRLQHTALHARPGAPDLDENPNLVEVCAYVRPRLCLYFYLLI